MANPLLSTRTLTIYKAGDPHAINDSFSFREWLKASPAVIAEVLVTAVQNCNWMGEWEVAEDGIRIASASVNMDNRSVKWIFWRGVEIHQKEGSKRWVIPSDAVQKILDIEKEIL